MKILHVIPSYEPAWAFGGTVTATSELCRALARKGIDVTVYTTDANGKGGYLDVPLNEPVNLGGVKVNYFHCDFGINRAFYSKNLAKRLKATVKDFDIVHVSAIWQYIQVDVYKACKAFSKPYIVSAHGSFSPWCWNQKTLKKELYWSLFGKKTVQNAAALHFTAEGERAKAYTNVKLLTKISSFIVPNGTEINNTYKYTDIRKNLNIPSNKFLLLFVGRIHRVKGIHFILKALKVINNQDFIFLIIGNKEDTEYVDQLMKLSGEIPNNVIWHEPVPRDNLWDFYHSADIFVLPSYHENFGIVVVEAMACGLPVLISKDVAIWREVLADNAGIVVNQDVDEIARVLQDIYHNKERLRDLSSNARKSVEHRYDINKVASLMIKAYQDILTDRNKLKSWK